MIITILVVGTSGLAEEEGFMPLRSLQYERAEVLEVTEEEVMEDWSFFSLYLICFEELNRF